MKIIQLETFDINRSVDGVGVLGSCVGAWEARVATFVPIRRSGFDKLESERKANHGIFPLTPGCAGKSTDDGGDGGGDGVPSQLNANELILSLDESELAIVCDAIADLYGGYGRTIECGEDLSLRAAASQQECVDDQSEIPDGCEATVGDTIGCMEDLAHRCDIETSDCLALFACSF